MEASTIVLVLVSLCGGAALVLLASTYREISTKVNVADYQIDKMKSEKDCEDNFRGINEDLQQLRRDFEHNLNSLENECNRTNKRIDSRADKLEHILSERINELENNHNKSK
tara:strand:+ start:6213 stop:6548 length:336 start_codon:yes stop_codon:yes gene_type:complete